MADQKLVEQKITLDMTIGDVVRDHPAVIPVLLESGVHCVGCGVAYSETLREGFQGHGMSDKQIQSVLNKMNEIVAKEPQAGSKDLIITDFAAKKISEFMKIQNKQSAGLRIGILSGGCSGYQYSLDFEDSASDEDIVFEESGVKVFMTKEHFQLLKGIKLDYIETLQGAGFKITNPNATKTCGCGQSFK